MSHERCVYESVDDRSLFYRNLSLTKNSIHAGTLTKMCEWKFFPKYNMLLIYLTGILN